MRATIERNCTECEGGSEIAFKAAVRKLEELVGGGYESAEARELLGDSYGQWAIVYEEDGSYERDALIARQREQYQVIFEQEPSNATVLDKLALVTVLRNLREPMPWRREVGKPCTARLSWTPIAPTPGRYRP